MTFYLGLYFGLGVISLLALFLLGKLKKRIDDEGLVFAHTVEDSWWEKTLIPAIGYSFMLLIWPALVIWKIKEELHPQKASEVLEDEEFFVKKAHLVQQVTIEEIECTEMVSDPLDAVPNQPFGHLNSVWLKFKESLVSDDVLWTFTAKYTNEWDVKGYKAGYVVVRNGNPGPYFLIANQSKVDNH